MDIPTITTSELQLHYEQLLNGTGNWSQMEFALLHQFFCSIILEIQERFRDHLLQVEIQRISDAETELVSDRENEDESDAPEFNCKILGDKSIPFKKRFN